MNESLDHAGLGRQLSRELDHDAEAFVEKGFDARAIGENVLEHGHRFASFEICVLAFDVGGDVGDDDEVALKWLAARLADSRFETRGSATPSAVAFARA